MKKLWMLLMLACTAALALTGCGGDLLAAPGSSGAASASASAPAKAPTYTAIEQQALETCVDPSLQKNYKPGMTGLDSSLLGACRTTGKTAYDGLSATNKAQPIVKDDSTTLATTTDLGNAVYLAGTLVAAKKEDAAGVTVSDTAALAAQIRGFLPNETQSDVLIGSTGTGAINPATHTVETGGSPYYNGNNKTFLSTPEQVGQFLNSGTPQANADKARVVGAIKAAGGSDAEVARALTGAGFIPIQLTSSSEVLGTSYYQNGAAIQLDSWRQSQAGDIYWIYVTASGKLVPGATVRADCGNSGATMIRIVKPGIPPAVPVTQPPGQETCSNGLVPQPNGECLPPTPTPSCTSGCGGSSTCTSNCTTTPPCTSCLEAKNPAQDPAAQGNAGNGGGVNANPGPGTYVPPAQMQQPPATPRTNPPAPAPTTGPVQQQASGGGTTTIAAPNPNPAPFTPAPRESGVNPVTSSGSGTPTPVPLSGMPSKP